MKKKKGISLAILVISIIVMTILAGTIIIPLTKTNIIGRANEAVEATNLKTVQEMATMLWAKAYMAGARKQPEFEAAIIEGLKDIDTTDYKIDVTTSGVTVSKFVALPEQLMVGDIVQYTPASNYTASKPYVVSLAGCSGSFYSDDLAAESVQWKVLSVDRDAGTIEIIPSTASTPALTFSGAHGYNNAIKALNSICRAVYGNTMSANYTAKADSLTLEDINEISGYVPSDSVYSQPVGGEGNNYIPIKYLEEKGIKQFSAEDIANGYATNSTITIEQEYYSYLVEKEIGFNKKFSDWFNIGIDYWLATDWVNLPLHFGVPVVLGTSYMMWEAGTAGLSGWSYSADKTEEASRTDVRIRPVVTMTLKKNLSLDKTEGTGDTAINYWIFEE